MRRNLIGLAIGALAFGAVVATPAPAAAQGPSAPPASPDPDSPAALVALALDRFAHATPDSFDVVHPDADARQLVRYAVEASWPRRAEAGGVVSVNGDSAVVWLAGYAETGHSGYETSLGRMFTGLYAAVRQDDGWRLAQKLELDRGNRIRSQTISVQLRPGYGLRVRDTLDIETGHHGGFWASLNRVAALDSVIVDGMPAQHRFDAGLLWIDVPPERRLNLVLEYTLDIARDSAKNGYFARFERDFGHARNQHYWHPFFGFRNVRSAADFRLTVQAPAAVQVATDLPQTDTVVDGTRIVTARSSHPTGALTLMYDRRWDPAERTIGSMLVRLAVDDSVQPSRSAITEALERVHRVLSGRFGEPRSRYLAVVQGRGQQGHGWIFRSNDMLGGGPVGGELVRTGERPRALFGHEAAHGWTAPAGPGSNWLSEGWAMYAESLLLADEFGAETAARFWRAMETDYLGDGYEGKASLADDAVNGGVSYAKGAWVLRMLEDHVGAAAFEQAMRRWMSLPDGTPATTAAFVAAMSDAAGRDIRPFLQPWLEETVIPRIEAKVQGDELVITQPGPLFVLDVDLDLVTSNGTSRRRVHLTAARSVVPLEDGQAVTGVEVDPDHRLLIHRSE